MAKRIKPKAKSASKQSADPTSRLFINVTESISAWMNSVLNSADLCSADSYEISHSPLDSILSADLDQKACILGLSLVSIKALPPKRTQRKQIQEYELSYILSCRSHEVEQEQGIWAHLFVNATNQSLFELGELDSNIWADLNCAPRPAILLKAKCALEPVVRDTQLVTKPLVLKDSPLTQLAAQVVVETPNGTIPLAAARVQIPALRMSTSCDGRGRFSFEKVPSDPPIKKLLIFARGQILEHEFDMRKDHFTSSGKESTVEQVGDAHSASVIRFPLLEE